MTAKGMSRILATLLISSLSLPNSALALRQTGLEEAEGEGKPKAQLIAALTDSSVSTPVPSPISPSVALVTPTAGLEEIRLANWDWKSSPTKKIKFFTTGETIEAILIPKTGLRIPVRAYEVGDIWAHNIYLGRRGVSVLLSREPSGHFSVKSHNIPDRDIPGEERNLVIGSAPGVAVGIGLSPDSRGLSNEQKFSVSLNVWEPQRNDWAGRFLGVLLTPSISTNHLRIWHDSSTDELVITDLSTQGVYLDGGVIQTLQGVLNTVPYLRFSKEERELMTRLHYAGLRNPDRSRFLSETFYSFSYPIGLPINRRQNRVALRRVQEEVFRVGDDREVVAHGTENIASLIEIILDGEIRIRPYREWYGRLAGGDPSYMAGPHGPFYIILNSRAKHSELRQNHLAYLVPDESDRSALVGILSKAVESGLGERSAVNEAVSKIITYEQFVQADGQVGPLAAGLEEGKNLSPATSNQPATVLASIAGAEERVLFQDTNSGEILKGTEDGVTVEGYTTLDGQPVPQQLMESELLVPGQTRLLVPMARIGTDLHIYAQVGLLDEGMITALRSKGIQVDTFNLSDIPEVNPREKNIFVAAVEPNSPQERRMHSYGSVMINLYGSKPIARPRTPDALATLVRVARRFDGLLRLNGMMADDTRGIASLDLAA